MEKMTRVLCWNVNGIRAITGKGFLNWLGKEKPDILCTQETKADPSQLDQSLISPFGYHSFWASAKKKGYSGVNVYSKEKPISVSYLGDERFDDEGRVLIAEYPGFVLLNAYFPNSQEEGKRLDYKLAFCETVHKKCNGLLAQGKRIVLCGDYNIAHRPIDLARPKENEGNPGYLPQERAWMENFTSSGYIDTFRHFQPEPHNYTWWSYRAGARERNVGWRIDYFCVNSDLMDSAEAALIHPSVLGSDHCPIELRLKLAS